MATSKPVPGNQTEWPASDLNLVRDAVVELQGIANGGSQTVLPASNGTDDTAALNTILAAGGMFAGKNLETYHLSGPLILPSETQLDMGLCTILLNPLSPNNMLVNKALTLNKRMLDAVTTATSTTLTSATAGFTQADVGKPVTIQGAGTAGAPHTTTIASVTNGTTAVLTLAAVTTVSGQYAVIGARDSNITVIGGIWDWGTNVGGGNAVTTFHIRLRHIDGVRVLRTRHRSIGGKYAVSIGDSTRFLADGSDFSGHSSDGIHINGPCSFGTIRNQISAAMHDDLVSITCQDGTGSGLDVAGDITDVTVDGVKCMADSVGSFTAALKLIAGRTTDSSAPYNLKRLRATDIDAVDGGAACVYLGDSAGGNFDDIVIDGVRSLGGATKGCVSIHGGNSIDRIVLKNLEPDPNDSYAVSVDVSVNRLDVQGVQWTPTGAGAYVVLVNGGTLAKLLVSRAQVLASNDGALVRVVSGATVTSVQLTQNTTDGINKSVSVLAGGAVGIVNIDDFVATTCAYPLGIYAAGTTTLEASNVNATGMTGWLQTTGGTVNIIGISGMSGDVNTVSGSNITGGYLFGIGLRATPAYGAAITPDLLKGMWQSITATNGTAFTINAPTNAPPGGKVPEIVVEILNSSGGVLGAITWNGNYVLSAGAFVAPANTKRRWIRFQSMGNGSTWVEVARAAADI